MDRIRESRERDRRQKVGEDRPRPGNPPSSVPLLRADLESLPFLRDRTPAGCCVLRWRLLRSGRSILRRDRSTGRPYCEAYRTATRMDRNRPGFPQRLPTSVCARLQVSVGQDGMASMAFWTATDPQMDRPIVAMPANRASPADRLDPMPAMAPAVNR